jgi:hypothetical protein
MPVVSVIVFALGAAVGLAMAVAHFRGKTSPQAIGYLHGAFTVSGALLLLAVLLEAEREVGNGWLVLGLFVLAALGGGYLHYRKHQGKPWPDAVILAHGGTALVALTLRVFWLL